MVLEDISKWMDKWYQGDGGETNYNNEFNFIIYINKLIFIYFRFLETNFIYLIELL